MKPNPEPEGGPDKKDWKPDFKPDWKPDNAPKRKKKGKGKKMPEGYRDARRDVRLTYKPLMREIRRTRKQGTRDANQQINRTQNVYEALGNTLAPLSGQMTSQSGEISNMLQGQLGSLGGMLNSNVPLVPQGEISAGAGMMGALGGSAMSELASNAQRNLSYNTSAQRQGALESGISQRNILQDLGDFRQDLGQQRIDIMKDVPSLIRQRMDELRNIEFQKMMGLRDMDLKELIANRSNSLANRGLSMEQQQQNIDNSAWQQYFEWKQARGGA